MTKRYTFRFIAYDASLGMRTVGFAPDVSAGVSSGQSACRADGGGYAVGFDENVIKRESFGFAANGAGF